MGLIDTVAVNVAVRRYPNPGGQVDGLQHRPPRRHEDRHLVATRVSGTEQRTEHPHLHRAEIGRAHV